MTSEHGSNWRIFPDQPAINESDTQEDLELAEEDPGSIRVLGRLKKRRASTLEDDVHERTATDDADLQADGVDRVPTTCDTKEVDEGNQIGTQAIPRSVAIPPKFETAARVRAMHDEQLGRLWKRINLLETELKDVRKQLAQKDIDFSVLNEWKNNRAEGMLKKGYAFQCYCRTNQRLPPQEWFRSNSDYAPKF